MEYNKSGTETYYRQMLELQEKLRRSEEERLKLEEKFNEILQHSRDAEHERLRITRQKYHKFLEEDKQRQQRNENILRTLDRIECRAKQLSAKTDRFKTFRKQYFENYLKQIPKHQTFNLNTHHQPQHENVRRKLFSDHPTTTTTINENVETKLALLEKYLRDNFDNFPRDFPNSVSPNNQHGIHENMLSNDVPTTRVLYDNKSEFDGPSDVSDSKESQEIDRYNKMNGLHPETSRLLLGNRIEKELDRLRDKREKELNNNSLDAQEMHPEQVIDDYKKLVLKSEEKYGLKNDLQIVGSPKKQTTFDININKNENKTKMEENDASQIDEIPHVVHDEGKEIKLKLDLLEEESNSEDTKPPTDISLDLSSPSQFKEQLIENYVIQQDQIEIKHKPYMMETSSKSEEITSIERKDENLQKIKTQDHQTKQSHQDQISNKFDDNQMTKTADILNEQQSQHLEQQIEYNTSNYPEEKVIASQPQANEFGESVANQQYLKEQKYPPQEYEQQENYSVQPDEYSEQSGSQYIASQNETEQEQYISEQQYQHPEQYGNVQPEYKQDDYKNTQLQGDTREVIYDKQQYPHQEKQYTNPEQQYEMAEHEYTNPEQQYENPEQQYTNSDQQYTNPEQQYTNPEQQYTNPEQQYETSEQPSTAPEQQYTNPEQQYTNPEQQYETSEQPYTAPEKQYEAPEQQYEAPEQQYEAPDQQYEAPEQYEGPEQQYEAPEQQYEAPEQQYESPEQQYESPEQQYEAPEQHDTNSAQQEYQSEVYNQQYSQENYQKGEYEQQNYPEVYENQQQENYETQNYPQQQYPEGYDPQQYTEEQQMEYNQQYQQQGDYDPQTQYADNLYQTGQEYLQGEQNVDVQYEAEQQNPDYQAQNYPEGYVVQENEQNVEKTIIENITESETSVQQQLEDNKPLLQKQLPNLADMLDTDTSESAKPDTKVSDSDFDFSNT